MRIDLESLVVAAADGNTAAFAQLVEETSSLVSSIALAILRDLDLSWDVAQEVFLSAWCNLRKLRHPGSFLPWLRQMTRNCAHTAQRTEWRRRKLGDSALNEMLPAVIDPSPDCCQQLIAAEQVKALEEALASLPEDSREVLVLFYREDQSLVQVANLLELSEAAVRQRLSRARVVLRGSLQEQVGDTLRRSAPAAAVFTAGVIALLPLTAPSSASAATLAAAKAATPAAGLPKLLLAKLLVLAESSLPGALGGVGATLSEARRWYDEAADDEERRQLRVYMLVNVLVALALAIVFPAASLKSPSPWPLIGWCVAALAAGLVPYYAWLPRIVSRRIEDELRRDPEWALARRMLERRRAIRGLIVGVTVCLLAILYHQWWQHHLR